jgi:multisubunit Na+/H+ antiporter MnhC subunit
MGLRTHKPIGKWPHASRAVVFRRLRVGLIVTLAAIPLLALGFAFWAASPPPAGNGGMLLDHAGEALLVALLAAAIVWSVALTAFGVLRWIKTGEAPSA